MRAKTACLTMALTALSPLALAQGGSASAFDAYDTDESGAVEKQEFLGVIDGISTFRDWDTDGDGKLSRSEFQGVGLDSDFIEWDADRDSFVDNNEFYRGTFDTFDEDASGGWQAGEWNDAGDAGLLDN